MSTTNEKTIIIGIGGGSGSGKTTLLRRLGEVFNEQAPAIFSMDNYYNPIEAQQKDSNGIVNFDLPSAINEEQLTKDLISLSAGIPIEVKEYFFNSNPNKNVLLTIQPSRIIIVEGLFLFHYEGVKKLLDYTIFVDVEHETQLDRRIYRDQETRGDQRLFINGKTMLCLATKTIFIPIRIKQISFLETTTEPTKISKN
jgi:uridine kinase